MQRINFNKDEREIIAEFIYSFQSDILIKSDALKLVDVLTKYKLIEDSDTWREEINSGHGNFCERLLAIVGKNIPDDQGKEIMNEYRGIKKQ